MSTGSDRPVLRVIRGDATDEEIAAVVALLAARGGSGESALRDDGSTQVWSAHGFGHRHIRGVFHTGRHGWRTSFWPR